jgi:outer membrane receptor protein involved in Fe transport
MPETADTYTAGVVWSPSFAPGLNFTVDYFDIKVKDYISNIGADTIINGCVNGTQPDFCAWCIATRSVRSAPTTAM